MEKIHFYKTNKIYEGTTDFINKNVIVINFSDDIPITGLTNGFEILNENNDFVQAEYTDYTTVYRTYEENPYRIEFSNNGSIYEEPVIVEPDPYIPTLDEVKAMKIEELSSICSDLITNGVGVDINGTMEYFSYKDEDQTNLKEIFDLAVQSNIPMYYHADNMGCKLYTVEQIITIYSTASTNKMHHTTYFNQLKMYVNTLETIEEVENIVYGQELTGEHLETYNNAMLQAKIVLEALLSARANVVVVSEE